LQLLTTAIYPKANAAYGGATAEAADADPFSLLTAVRPTGVGPNRLKRNK